jgi:endonuclease/exonuclease/phosphatase family metal-dependent hydrolase
VRQADADVVLFQEVSDADAARAILGAQYSVASTHELWRGHSIAQNLAIGWRTTLAGTAPPVEVIEPISQIGADGRRTRPGLALTLDLDGDRRLAILNLHLKAGCRQGRLNEATSRKPEQAFRRKANCRVFQQQIPALERWADDKLRKGIGVMIAGDFNRDLLREIRDTMPARSDGSDPARPVQPERISSLVAEISDEDPPAAWFALIRARRYTKLADCHRNIDSFLLSRNVEPWLASPLRQLSATVIPFAEPVALDRVRPSDHCPHLVQLPLRGWN